MEDRDYWAKIADRYRRAFGESVWAVAAFGSRARGAAQSVLALASPAIHPPLGDHLGRGARVTSQDDSAYRLRLASTFLQKGREAAMFARGSIENAAKSVLACLTGVPRSHEPGALLEEALAQPTFPSALRVRSTLFEAPEGAVSGAEPGLQRL